MIRMNTPTITLDGTSYPLNHAHLIRVASTTSNGSYELRVFPHSRGIDTTCSCPARVACIHRKTFAQIVGVQLDGEVLVSGASITWVRPPAASIPEPADPFEGVA